MDKKLLEVKNLKTSFFTHLGEVKAIRGVDFYVNEGESIGIVGESGSGKSVTSLSIMRLLEHPGRIVDGEIIFKDKNIVKCSPKEMTNIRGNEISMIFQDPMTSLNPVLTIGKQLREAIIKHQQLSKADAVAKSVEMLKLVGIPSPEKRVNNYPHEFSGGMRQRAMIAIALSCEPSLLIADEPTTALDPTIQAQILSLMKDLRETLNTSIILITHDLGVVADVCSRILVMYGGLIMEEGSTEDIFYNPLHPYTMGLLNAIPNMKSGSHKRLVPILGTPPDLLNPPTGCPFYSRCQYAMQVCRHEHPREFVQGEGHRAACWLLDDEAPRFEEYEMRKGGVRYGRK